MTRHSTIGYPAKWIEPVLDIEGVELTPGYLQSPYQEDIEFTSAEELEADARDIRGIAEGVERDAKRVERDRLEAELFANTITFEGLKKLMRGGE